MFKSVIGFFVSFYVFLKVKWFLFREAKEIRHQFPTFLPFEKALDKAYRFSSPFSIYKQFLKQRQEEAFDAYGETPIPVLAQMAEMCGLTAKDVLFDLGCGRGRSSLFLAHLIDCQVIGIDWVPFFIKTADEIMTSVCPQLPVRFHCGDICHADFSQATVIFLYGTCFSEEIIASLVTRFEKLSSTIKVLTLSYPLSDYHSSFYVHKQFEGQFPWGEGTIYLNLLKI